MIKKKRKQRGDTMQDVEQTTVNETEIPAAEADVQENEAQKPQEAVTPEMLAEALAQKEEYLNLAQRVQADFDNFRRRNQNVRKEAFDEGARAFAATLLPVIDNLERAIAAAQQSSDESLRSGVEMVYRQLCEAFEKRGITPIDRKGEKFDPNLENAVMQGTADEGEPGTVCEVFQKGYQMDGAVLRHAMVKVVAE
jgi:molecular chaperone GrpE